MNEEQYKVLLESIRDLQESVGRIDRDLANDRQKMGDIQVEIAGLKAEVSELRKGLKTQANKVQDKVTDAVLPVMAETQMLKEQIKKKKTLVLKERISLLRMIFGRLF